VQRKGRREERRGTAGIRAGEGGAEMDHLNIFLLVL